MRLRQARKLVRAVSAGVTFYSGGRPRRRHHRAVRRFLRWRHRPRLGFGFPSLPLFTLDDHGRVSPFKGDTCDHHLLRKLRQRVAWTEINGITVSTIFLGIDHNWGGSGPPVLFETMIELPGQGWSGQRRYSDLRQAMIGHDVIAASLGLI